MSIRKKQPMSFAEHILLSMFFLFVISYTYLGFHLYGSNIDASQATHANIISPFKQDDNQEEFVLTSLRSALYQYVKREGDYPESLEELTGNFPRNYLSAIPVEPYSKSDDIYPSYNKKGGWVYKRPNVISSDLERQIEYALFPNTDSDCVSLCTFAPFEIHVSKEDNVLYVLSGEEVVGSYPVGLGRQNKTPVGKFMISKKVHLPNHHLPNSDNPFGSRGLEFNEKYAIHGTNNGDSIGENESDGCIRAYKEHIEELYTFVPLRTNITIHKYISEPPIARFPGSKNRKSDGVSPSGLSFFASPHNGEMDKERRYRWSN